MYKPLKKLTECPNCQTPLEQLENYCPSCGQKNEDILLPVKAHLADAFESVFNWDARFWVTLKVMFTQPGKLTAEFNEGKRKRYVPPLRLYLIASVLFFLLLSMGSKKDLEQADKALESMATNTSDTMELSMVSFKLKLTGKEIFDLNKLNDEQLDSFLLVQGIEPGIMNRLSLKQSMKVMTGNISGLYYQFTQAASIGMFVLMPAFAAILMLFFRKPKRFYVEHLICSIHLHTLAFLLFSLHFLLMLFFPLEIFNWLIYIIIGVYVFLYLKNIYEKRDLPMIGYYFLISIFYLILLLIGLLGVVLASLLFF